MNTKAKQIFFLLLFISFQIQSQSFIGSWEEIGGAGEKITLHSNGTGILYSLEMEEDFEIEYTVDGNQIDLTAIYEGMEIELGKFFFDVSDDVFTTRSIQYGTESNYSRVQNIASSSVVPPMNQRFQRNNTPKNPQSQRIEYKPKPVQKNNDTNFRSNYNIPKSKYNKYRGSGNVTGKWVTVNAEGVYNYLEVYPSYFIQINPVTGYKAQGQVSGFIPNGVYCGGLLGSTHISFRVIYDKRSKTKNILSFGMAQGYQKYNALYVRLPDGFQYNGLKSLKNIVPARKQSDCSGNYVILDTRAVGAVSTSNTTGEGNYEVTRSTNSSFYDHSKSKGTAVITQQNGLYTAAQGNGIRSQLNYGNLIMDKIIIPPTVGGNTNHYTVIHLNNGSCQNAEITFSSGVGLYGGILSK